jgi:hypothetical protein
MIAKSLEILAVANGYVISVDKVPTCIFNTGEELDLIKLICELFVWEDVIDFPPEERSTPPESEDNSLQKPEDLPI